MTNYERINRKFEQLFHRRVKRAIDNKIDSLIYTIQSNGLNAGIQTLNNSLTNPALVTEIRRLYRVVGIRHADETTRKLRAVRGWRPLKKKGFISVQEGEYKSWTDADGCFNAMFTKGFGFNETWIEFIENYLRFHLIEKITFDVNTTTRNFLLRVLQKSIREGLGVDETVRNLRESGFSDMQSARIVRTEVNTAANTGVIAAGQTYDYEMLKEWVAIHDRRTRGTDPEDHANHVALNGTTIDFEDTFTDPRNGDVMVAPGDPGASAASIINCRCTLILKPKRDERGRLIPKRTGTVRIITPRQNISL